MLYPGVAQSLERLAAAELPLGVVTNKARAFSVRLLERLAVAPRFARSSAATTAGRRSPPPT
jgi:phosphoglycolate phosphatase